MKLFYFMDFMHTKQYGTPITYDNYVNLEHGPIPSNIKNLVDTAADDPESSLLSDIITIERPRGIEMYRVLCNRKFSESDERYFSESELKILKQVCDIYGEKTTGFVEEASHKESAWKNTNLLDPIPYELAAKDDDAKVTKEEIKLMLEI